MGQPKRVAVCDDEPYILECVSFIVREEGFDVMTATDGDEALRLIRTERPDLVLLDVMMPGRSGFDVCREIRADESMRSTYVLLLTAKGQERDIADGYESGADDCWLKPFSPCNLRTKLHEVLG